MTTDQAKALLLSLLPRGYTRWFDFSKDSFGDLILDGAAEQFALRVGTPTETLQLDGNPWTLTATGLAAWESVLGLQGTATALYGTTAARKAAIVSKLREHGSFTLANIRAIVGPLLGYADPTQLQIIECDRALLDVDNQYDGSTTTAGVTGATVQHVTIADNSTKISGGGARLVFQNLICTATDISVELIGPDSTSKTWNDSRYFTGLDPSYFLAGEFAGKQINGQWSVQVVSATHPYSFDSWQILVESIGRVGTSNVEGLGSEMFRWAVLVDPTLAGVANVADYAAARTAITRIQPAHTQGFLVFKQSNGAQAARADDTYATADGCVCG